MPYEWTIAIRYLRSRRSRMVSLITTISIVGVALGVMLLIVVLSVMGGFASDLREKIVATKAHVVVGAERGNLADPELVLAAAEAHPRVTGAAPYIESEVMISTASSVDGIVLRGIDLDRVGQTSALPESIREGRLEWLRDSSAAVNERSQRLRTRLRGVGEDSIGEGATPPISPVPLSELPPARPGSGQAAPEGTGFSMPPIPVRRRAPEPPAPLGSEGSEATTNGAGEGEGTGFTMPPIPGQRSAGAETTTPAPPSPMPPIGRPRPSQDPTLPGIAIGSELANRLHVGVGSEVTIISPDGQLLPTGPAPLSRPFVVVATFYTGMYEFDTRFAYVVMDEARSMLRIPAGQVTAVDIKVDDLDAARSVASDLAGALAAQGRDDALVRSWEELNKSLFAALKLEKIAIFVILTIIILVASFSIVSNLIVMVVERASEIAVLKSMGASNRSIVGVFGIQGGVIGAVGTTIGVVLGVGICLYIASGGIPLDTDVYYIEYLPVDLRPVEVLLTAVAGMVISLLATVYPAIKGARLNPAEALRYD